MQSKKSANAHPLSCSLNKVTYFEFSSKDLPGPSCPVEEETILVAEKESGFTISGSTPAVRLVLLSNLFAHRLIWFLRRKRKSLVMPASFPALGTVRRYWLEDGLLYAKGAVRTYRAAN
ncbi:hypothetical protein M9H77_00136 [Catharanthus roseus]|nr:hypothetical protein M9H77_00136 [Catharanthus roseus]